MQTLFKKASFYALSLVLILLTIEGLSAIYLIVSGEFRFDYSQVYQNSKTPFKKKKGLAHLDAPHMLDAEHCS